MRPLTLLFCLLALGAAGAVATPFLLPPPPAVPPPAAAPAGSAVPALPPVPALAGLSETRTRPIFTASRRPPVVAPVIALEDAAKDLLLGRYAKTGVVLLPDRRIVLLRDTVAVTSLRIAEGDRLDGWLLVGVGLDKLELEKDGARQTYVFPVE